MKLLLLTLTLLFFISCGPDQRDREKYTNSGTAGATILNDPQKHMVNRPKLTLKII